MKSSKKLPKEYIREKITFYLYPILIPHHEIYLKFLFLLPFNLGDYRIPAQKPSKKTRENL